MERERGILKAGTMTGIRVVGVKKNAPDCTAFMRAAEKAMTQRDGVRGGMVVVAWRCGWVEDVG